MRGGGRETRGYEPFALHQIVFFQIFEFQVISNVSAHRHVISANFNLWLLAQRKFLQRIFTITVTTRMTHDRVVIFGTQTQLVNTFVESKWVWAVRSNSSTETDQSLNAATPPIPISLQYRGTYRGTSLIRNSAPLGPYRRPMPGDLW